MLLVFNVPGVRAITATQCQQPENLFAVKKLTKSKIFWLVIQYHSVTLHMEFPNACLSRVVLLIASHSQSLTLLWD